MKLRDFLETIDENEIVAIGALTSYLYLGHPHNYAEIEELSKKLYTDSGEILRNTKAILDVLPDRKEHLRKELDSLIKTCRAIVFGSGTQDVKKRSFVEFENGVKDVVKKMIDCEHKNYRCRKKTEKLAEYRANFVELLDREVETSYRQPDSDYAYVIIINGPESGRYWTYEEYKNKNDVDEVILEEEED